MTRKNSGKGRRGKSNPNTKRENDAASSKCGCMGNHPAWYTKEQIPPAIGANFDALTSVNTQPVVFTGGIKLNVGIRHETIPCPPIDEFNSLKKAFSSMYSMLQAKNRSAYQYSPVRVMAYVLNLQQAYMIAYLANRVLKAVRSRQKLNMDSPYYLVAHASGSLLAAPSDIIDDYDVAIDALTLVAKDLENYPCPHMSMFDRTKFLYSQFFADSKSMKAAITSFMPRCYFIYDVDTDGNLVATPYPLSRGKASDYIPILEAIIDDLNSSKYGILRGDLIKTFPDQFVPGLVEDSRAPLNILFDEDVNAQLENASILFTKEVTFDASSVSLDVMSDNNPELIVDIAGLNDPSVKTKADFTQQMINFHGNAVPNSGQLLSITRLMPVAKQVNGTLKSQWHITGTSGDVIIKEFAIIGVTSTSITYTSLSSALIDAQTSTVQSTMRNALNLLSWCSKMVDYYPLIVTDPSSPTGYQWDVDDYALVTTTDLMMYTRRANRSLSYVPPLGELAAEIGIAARRRE